MKLREAYSYNRNLDRILKTADKKAFFKIHEAVEYYISQYERGKQEVGDISIAASFQEAVQKNIDENKNTELGEVRCGKGCSFCCHYHVDISDDEAKLLVEYAKEQNIAISKTQLKKQKDKTVDTWSQLKYSERRCVFLDENGSCKAYEYRPVSCRVLQVITDPKLCNAEFDTNDVGALSILEVDIMATAINNATKSDSMAKLLLDLLL
jgi:Fe-S-cluster containining protein